MSDKFELHEAARNGNKLIVQGLLADKPRLVFLKDDDGRVALHWAVSSQKTDIVELLLSPLTANNELTSGIETKGESSGNHKSFEIDIDDLIDDAGWSPLHIAVSVGSYKITKMLLDHEPHPDVDLTTSTGLTLLHLATSKKQTALVELLIKDYGASARIKDRRGQYPLHRAASVGSVAIAELLVNLGKSPLNAKDNSGWVPLHHALAEGNADVAAFLVKAGADASVQDSDGLTPLKVAVDEKVAKFFKLACEELGVDVD